MISPVFQNDGKVNVNHSHLQKLIRIRLNCQASVGGNSEFYLGKERATFLEDSALVRVDLG